MAEQQIHSQVVQRCRYIFSMHDQLDDFLDDVKCQDKQAEQKRLIDRYPKQWLGFLPAAEPRIFTNENDFGDHGGIDQGGAIAEIRNVILLQQEPLVGDNSTEEKSQIQEDADKFLTFVNGLLLKIRVFRVFGSHLASAIPPV